MKTQRRPLNCGLCERRLRWNRQGLCLAWSLARSCSTHTYGAAVLLQPDLGTVTQTTLV